MSPSERIAIEFLLVFQTHCTWCPLTPGLLSSVSLCSHYDLSDSSSGESSPEHPSLNKRTNFRHSPAAGCVRGKKPPLDSSPGYNSSEEYDGSLVRFPYCDLEVLFYMLLP